MPRTALLHRPIAVAAPLFCSIFASSVAFAQEEATPPPEKPATTKTEWVPPKAETTAATPAPEAEPAPAPAATAEPAAAEESPAEASSGDEPSRAEMAREIAELKAGLQELKAKQEEAEMAALLADEEVDVDQEVFSLYGFMDMGLQKQWVGDDALLSFFFDVNAATFAVGNIDLYFDFNPDEDWRALSEIRFTGAPHGRVNTLGGITGEEFERENTEQFDPHGTVVNAPMWGGSIVIERAWIEWKKYQEFKVRTGNFFTPFGIWNVDHGSPTLISTAMPQFIQQTFFPLRQTGVQALGSFFKGDWELAYRAWLSNGRQELANLDFNDDKAFGFRTFARKDGGSVRMMAGATFHHGRVADRIKDVDVDDAGNIIVNNYESFAYHENVMGLDLSVDVGDTRIRWEGAAQLRQYEEGKRPEAGLFGGDTLVPDSWRFATYGIVAHQLPWYGIEPYMYVELIQQTWAFPDALIMFAPGVNVRFTPAAQLKLQATRALFFNLHEEYEGTVGANNVTTALARIVLAF